MTSPIHHRSRPTKRRFARFRAVLTSVRSASSSPPDERATTRHFAGFQSAISQRSLSLQRRFAVLLAPMISCLMPSKQEMRLWLTYSPSFATDGQRVLAVRGHSRPNSHSPVYHCGSPGFSRVTFMTVRRPRHKPLSALSLFALKLGWPDLRCWQQAFENDGATVTWYEARESEGARGDLFLQINECPIGQTATYTAAVYAIRYRICTGWHAMKLTPDGRCDDIEVKRLDSWLHRRWFDTPDNRRAFRRLHPECSGWTSKRIREEGFPYGVVDAKNYQASDAPFRAKHARTAGVAPVAPIGYRMTPLRS